MDMGRVPTCPCFFLEMLFGTEPIREPSFIGIIYLFYDL